MNLYELNPNQELRLLCGDEPIKVELRRGLAEIHGTELLANRTYTFSRDTTQDIHIFTYHGAAIEVTGSPLKCHVGQKCDYMLLYLSIHGDLERLRMESELNAQDNAGNPPICLVCQPMCARNVGKSRLCKILLNYAARRGRTPIYVDLDPDQGHAGIPGSLSATSIEAPIDIEDGISSNSSLVMHFGHTSISSENGVLYQALVDSMAKIVNSKLEQDRKSFNSGVIINTCCWSSDMDYKILVQTCKAFRANTVLVMDDEVLQDDLKKDLGDCTHPVSVLNVPKTVGLVARTLSEPNVELRLLRMKKYFYGTPHEPFNPDSSEIKYSFIKRLIYRMSNPMTLPDSLMPLGSKKRQSKVEISKYDVPASDLKHRILAISYAKIDDVTEDPDILLNTNIMGFMCITEVMIRKDNDMLRIMKPQKLPNPMDHVLLYSEVQYMDS